MDSFLPLITYRFVNHKITLSGFQLLLSDEITTSNTEDLFVLVKPYDKDLLDHNKDILILELKFWIPKNKCTSSKT